jgi:hypothetical protein
MNQTSKRTGNGDGEPNLKKMASFDLNGPDWTLM